jgi:hypothetical protein
MLDLLAHGSAANQTRIEQRLFGRWIKGADDPLFARASTDRCGKACASQFVEPLLGFCDLRTILLVENVAGVTGMIHHYLTCHSTHSDWLPTDNRKPIVANFALPFAILKTRRLGWFLRVATMMFGEPR